MKVLKRVPPNLGVQKEYKRKLDKLVSAMSKSVMYWTLAEYGKRTPREMADAIQKRIKQWKKVFGKEADKIALWFVNSVRKHTEDGMSKAFKDAGVKMHYGVSKQTRQAIEIENVDLIESVPDKYFTGIETIAMLSILYGWNQTHLTNELIKRYNITMRRVKNISLDQTHKATELFKKDICRNEGINEAIWVYTFRSETPRINHIMMDGQRFDLDKGALTPEGDEFIMPGQKINCKCDFRPIIKEFGDE